MVEMVIKYEGGLRCRAMHGPSGSEIITDAPLDNCGKGEAFSPTDLVATALGACMATVMGILAEREGWDLRGMKVRVTKEMVSDPVRRIGKIAAEITVPAGVLEDARKKLERAAHTCPVRQSLREEVETPVTFVYQ